MTIFPLSLDVNSTWLPETFDENFRLGKAYARFFPIFSDEGRRILEPLRGLNEYKVTKLSIAKENLASIGSFLIDRYKGIMLIYCFKISCKHLMLTIIFADQ